MTARLPPLPIGDALDDATVLIAGRGPLYPKLSVAMGERVKMLGALSVETAAKHLNARDIDGIVVGDGFSPRMVEAFLTVLAQDSRFRDIPVAVIGEAPPEFTEALPNIDHVDGDPARLVARMVPLVRMHAFEARLNACSNRSMPTACSIRKPACIRATHSAASSTKRWSKPPTAARRCRSRAFPSTARSTSAPAWTPPGCDAPDPQYRFGCRDDDGALLIAFTQTDLRSAHVVARRIAGLIKKPCWCRSAGATRSPPK